MYRPKKIMVSLLTALMIGSTSYTVAADRESIAPIVSIW